jgi:hypothetical protein
MDLLDFYIEGKSNYIVFLDTKKRYNLIFTKCHHEPKLLESVPKTLSGTILVFEKNTAECRLNDGSEIYFSLIEARNIKLRNDIMCTL